MVYAVSAWVLPKHPQCQNPNRKGLQWAESFATPAITGELMGPPLITYD